VLEIFRSEGFDRRGGRRPAGKRSGRGWRWPSRPGAGIPSAACRWAAAAFLPVGDAARGDGFALQPEVGGEAQPRCRPAGLQQCSVQCEVAVGRFDEDLRLRLACRLGLEFRDAFAALGLARRQVAVEGKALAVQARGHQRQQQGGGPDQRLDRDAQFMGAPHQQGAGIGYRRAAGLGHQAEVDGRQARGQQAVDLAGRERFRQLLDVQFAQGSGWPRRLSSARAVLAFSTTKWLRRQAASRLAGGRKLSQAAIAQRHRQQPESAGSCVRAAPRRPCAACRTARSAAGRPGHSGRRRAGRSTG
jgi:hypothetical protein